MTVKGTASRRSGNRYQRIAQILDVAAGSAEPGYDGQGRFWDRGPAALEATTIYGVPMIAPPDEPYRGPRSGLVIGLRGEPPFDGTQFPPLPWGGKRVAPRDIQLISDWIDDDLPETDDGPKPRPVRPTHCGDVVLPPGAPPPSETDDPNAYRDRLGAIKARQDVEHLTPTELANLRAAIAETVALNKYPADKRSYNAWAQLHGDECPHGWSVFMPWHRIFLWAFEKQLQYCHPSVTLPYWDWTRSTPQQIREGYIPEAYRCKVTEAVLRGLSGKVKANTSKALETVEDKTFNSIKLFWEAAKGISPEDQADVVDALKLDNPLFTDRRWPGDFGGPTIADTFHHHYPTASDIEGILGLKTWRSFGGGGTSEQGFGLLEMDPHNTMHIWIGGCPHGLGGQQGYMLANLTAAFDPIFWAHHANIDRLWARWQVLHPGADPPDLNDVLPGLHTTVADSLSTSKLGYEYAADTHLLVADPADPVALLSTPRAGAVPEVLADHRIAELRMHRIRQPKQSSVVRVFLNAPEADISTPVESNIHYAGHFTIFGHGPCIGGPGHCEPVPRTDPFDHRLPHHNEPWNVNFDITDAVAALVADGARDIQATLVVVDLMSDHAATKLELDGVSLSFHH
ncbi:MAG: tyrosinase [bacterium]|jgi:tyrosinase